MIQRIKKYFQNARQSAWSRKTIRYSVALFLVFLIFLPVFSQRTDYENKIVKSVTFTGLQNASEGELRSFLNTIEGFPLSGITLNSDIKNLFNSGYFSNVLARVSFNQDGTVNVIFEVTELPRVESIDFKGVEELYPADLKAGLPLKEGDVFNSQKVQDGISVIKKKYKDEGFFLAEVWSASSDLDAKKNTISVVYIVDEGDSIPIARINILGLRKTDPDSVLGVMEHKSEGFMESGIFQESKYEEDKFRILAYLKSQGYLDADINEKESGYEIRWRNPRKPEDGRVIVITYSVTEGEVRYFGGYSASHDPAYLNQELNPPERRAKDPDKILPVYPKEMLLDVLEFSENNVGDIFDEGRFFRDRTTLQELYANRGYVFAQIQPVYVNVELTSENIQKYKDCLKSDSPAAGTPSRCKEEAEWINPEKLEKLLKEQPEYEGRILRHVHFIIRENNLAYIESIIVKGMVKTQEHVIRRELLIKEGQLYNAALVNRSRERLINLGYFKEVNMQMRPGSDDRNMNLIMDVVEQPTGTISMGGGFGTTSGFSIFVEGGESNLNGTGQRLSGKLNYGPTTQQLGLTWTDPWFYEACSDSTGSFWKNKQKQFDEARDFDTVLSIASTLQNAYLSYNHAIHKYVADETADGPAGIEALDRVKSRIRSLLYTHVSDEESCYRSMPRPWALSLSASYTSSTYENIASTSLYISDQDSDFFEMSSYDVSAVGVGVGISHSFLLNWAHYHRYSPSWSQASNPTALVSDVVLKRTALGWQFKSSFTNGLIYDNRDNVFSPSEGVNLDFSVETVGQMLGGQDHYNQYTASFKAYHWWFDYTFGGLFRRNALRKWRVVQEFRGSAIFTHETVPYNKKQDKEINPYLEQQDRLYLGGYESLRGYDYADSQYPVLWRDGGNHMLLWGTELRMPIEPSILWMVLFMDAGALYENLGEKTGEEMESISNYTAKNLALIPGLDPSFEVIYNKYNLMNGKPYFHGNITDWWDPSRTVFSRRNIAMDRMMYSWGFGLRIQIPVLPLRLFMAQKVYYAGNMSFKPIPGDDKWEFVFGIGDYRF